MEEKNNIVCFIWYTLVRVHYLTLHGVICVVRVGDKFIRKVGGVCF